MNGFDSQGEGTADSENIERKPALGAASSQRTLRSSFVGPQGIRSGWSVLIFIAILMVEVLATRVPVNRLLHLMKRTPTLEAWSPAVAASILVLLVLVATAIMAKIEGRPVLSYGFINKRILSRFVLGIAGGVAALSALVLALKMSGWLIFPMGEHCMVRAHGAMDCSGVSLFCSQPCSRSRFCAAIYNLR